MKPDLIREVMKEEFDLRFTKTKMSVAEINSLRVKFCRQCQAKAIVGALDCGWRIINVDETFLVDTNFLRCKWR